MSAINLYFDKEVHPTAPTISTIMTDVATFFSSLITILTNLLMPATGTLSPLQVLMWAGLVLGFLVFVVGLVKRLASQG